MEEKIPEVTQTTGTTDVISSLASPTMMVITIGTVMTMRITLLKKEAVFMTTI
jgi:hypothetical protein